MERFSYLLNESLFLRFLRAFCSAFLHTPVKDDLCRRRLTLETVTNSSLFQHKECSHNYCNLTQETKNNTNIPSSQTEP